MNTFIPLRNCDIYNIIQSKIYKYFLYHHKIFGMKFDETIKNTISNEIYNISKIYCKTFKYDVCLCYRSHLKDNINENCYDEIYTCSNKKRILYNPNNFNLINPISFKIDDLNFYPINIFTFYRQEYIIFIIQEEFLKCKNNYNKIIIKKNKYYFRLFKYNILIYKIKIKQIKYFFNLFKQLYISSKIHTQYNKNMYYIDLIDVFDNKKTNNTHYSNNINYSAILSILK